MKYLSRGPGETGQIAAAIAKKLSKAKPSGKAIVIALEGELGAGKTTFVKGFARALGIKQKITSPTFVLIKSYKLKAVSYKLLWHIDAYRLKDHRDLIQLGVKEILNDPKNIVLIEWSDRVRKILPGNCVTVHIDHVGLNKRSILVK